MTPGTDPLAALGVVVPSRCSRRLTGNGAVRSCSRCGLPAYDVRLTTVDEVRDQVHRAERRTVFRYYLRRDGLLFTDACPRRPGWRLAVLPVVLFAGVIAFSVAMLRHAEPTLTDRSPGIMGNKDHVVSQQLTSHVELADRRVIDETLQVQWRCLRPPRGIHGRFGNLPDDDCEDLLAKRMKLLSTPNGQDSVSGLQRYAPPDNGIFKPNGDCRADARAP